MGEGGAPHAGFDSEAGEGIGKKKSVIEGNGVLKKTFSEALAGPDEGEGPPRPGRPGHQGGEGRRLVDLEVDRKIGRKKVKGPDGRKEGRKKRGEAMGVDPDKPVDFPHSGGKFPVGFPGEIQNCGFGVRPSHRLEKGEGVDEASQPGKFDETDPFRAVGKRICP